MSARDWMFRGSNRIASDWRRICPTSRRTGPCCVHDPGPDTPLLYCVQGGARHLLRRKVFQIPDLGDRTLGWPFSKIDHLDLPGSCDACTVHCGGDGSSWVLLGPPG